MQRARGKDIFPNEGDRKFSWEFFNSLTTQILLAYALSNGIPIAKPKESQQSWGSNYFAYTAYTLTIDFWNTDKLDSVGNHKVV